jgi:hypothetical protein
MPAFFDITGRRFGLWTALPNYWRVGKRIFWECRCDCGTTRGVCKGDLTGGQSTNCGCVRREKTAARNTVHGLRRSPEWNVWNRMVQRCHNPKNPGYRYYGARGVTVCDRWRSNFANFFEDMGGRPSASHELDRHPDPAGPYAPGNCRWVTHKQNCRNKRKHRRLTHDGKSLTISEWSELTGIKYLTIWMRVTRLGWSVADALTIRP